MVLCFLFLLFCSFTLCSISCVFAAFLKIIIPFPMVAEMTELLRKSIWILSSIYFYPWKGNLFAFRSISFDIWFVLFHFTIFNTYLPITFSYSPHYTLQLLFFFYFCCLQSVPHSFVLSWLYTQTRFDCYFYHRNFVSLFCVWKTFNSLENCSNDALHKIVKKHFKSKF